MRYEYIKTESTRDVIAALIKDIYLCIYLQHVSSSSHRYQYQRHRGVFPCLVYHDRGICFFFFSFPSYLALLLFFRDYLRDERFWGIRSLHRRVYDAARARARAACRCRLYHHGLLFLLLLLLCFFFFFTFFFFFSSFIFLGLSSSHSSQAFAAII